VRLDEVLSHRAGLHRLRSIESAAAPPAIRHRLAMAAKPPDGWDPSRSGAYSEWLGFYLVGQVLERASGMKLADLLRERLLEPLGIASEVSLGLEAEDHRRIGANVRLQAGKPLPLLMERVPWFAEARDPSLSPYATMRGLGKFYAWVLATIDGRQTELVDAELLRDACRPHRPVVHDPILDVEADWGLGFMTGLQRLGFGPFVGRRAVGQTGQVGTSMAFCDPEHNLAAAVLYNGVIDQKTGITVRRPGIVGAIYRDLGIAAPARDSARQHVTSIALA
jgi:CubicO group peptidase (beta-lactamase class C family)